MKFVIVMEPMAIEAAVVPLASTWDPDFFKKTEDEQLTDMGYEQQFVRSWDLLHSFGISLSVVVCIRSISHSCPIG
jgi:hypothetical protein